MYKLTTSLFVFLLVSFSFLTEGFTQNFSAVQNPKGESSPLNSEALVTIHYDGEDVTNSVGDEGTTFIGGARFTSAITGPLTGGELQSVQFFYAQDATGITVKIYDAGTSTAPGALLLDQPLNLGSLTVNGWNDVPLSTFIPITGNDLWICLEIADASGTKYPLGVDAGPANPDGCWVNDDGTWVKLTAFGLNYNWHIRGVVEDTPVAPPLFYDNFDSYTAGTGLVSQNPSFWQTWDGGAGEDPSVSNAFAHSAPNSVLIVENNDLVKSFGSSPYTAGKYKISFQAYVPAGKSGYFNVLNLFAGNNSKWGLEAYLNTTGVCSLYVGSATADTSTNYPPATWFPVNIIIDLDADLAEIIINGTSVATWQWSLTAQGGGGPKTLHASDFFGATANDQMYIDDFSVEDITVVPVELVSFTANVNLRSVVLNWTTATELNNSGFEVERKYADGQFVTIGHVQGNGTTTERQDYLFTDANVEIGTYTYRLKQIDFNGSFEYSNEIFANVTAPVEFNLEQNYPNPFNPSTTINFSIAEPSFVKLAVYNLLGEEIKILKNENMNAGVYNISFDASSLPSGIYLYKIETVQYTSAKKMMLMK